MRLGLSTLLVVALASASLVACGDSDTGSGGAGGGAGGETSAGGNDAGAGGDTGSGGDPGAGGGGGDAPVECTAEVVADAAECDADCNQNVTNQETLATFCTISCTTDADCSDDGTVVCAEDEASGETACIFDCSGDNVCPGSEFVCDQDVLLCFPDVAGE